MNRQQTIGMLYAYYPVIGRPQGPSQLSLGTARATGSGLSNTSRRDEAANGPRRTPRSLPER